MSWRKNSTRLPWPILKRSPSLSHERFCDVYPDFTGDDGQTVRGDHPGYQDARKCDKLPPRSGPVQDAQGQPGYRVIPCCCQERDKRVCCRLPAPPNAHDRCSRTKDLGGEESLVLSHIKAAGSEGMLFASSYPAPCSFMIGIWTKHLKGKTDLHQTVIDRCIKTLTQKQLIKAVKSVKVLAEFPSLRNPRANPTVPPSTRPGKFTCLPTSTLP